MKANNEILTYQKLSLNKDLENKETRKRRKKKYK